MKNSKALLSAFLFVTLLLIGAPTASAAEAPKSVQDIFWVNTKVDSWLLDKSVKDITTNIPIRVLTGNGGKLVGIEVGGEKSSCTMNLKNGQKDEGRIDRFVIPIDMIGKKEFTATLKVPVRGKIEIFYINGTHLDAQNGGTLNIRYVSSPIMGTKHKVQLAIKKEKNGRWSIGLPGESKSKRVAKIESSFTGLGLNAPKFEDLDPNKAVRILAQRPLADPREATALMKAGEQTLNQYIEKPVDMGYGLSLQIAARQGK